MLTSKMQNMSTEDDRTAFCKEICQEKKSVQKKRKNTWLLITEVIFNIKSSQPVIFSQTFMEALLSLYIYECAFGWVHKGVVGCSSLEGEMYKRELDLTTSCCPVHLTAGTSPLQPSWHVLPHYLTLLKWDQGKCLVTSYCCYQFWSFSLAMNLPWT